MRNIQKVIATGISVAMFTTMCVIAPAAASAEEATTTADTPALTIVTGENKDQVITTFTESELKELAAKETAEGQWICQAGKNAKVYYAPAGQYVTYKAILEKAGIDDYDMVIAGASDGFPGADKVSWCATKDRVDDGQYFPAWDGATTTATEGATAAPGAVLLSWTDAIIGEDLPFAASAIDSAKKDYNDGNAKTAFNSACGTTLAEYQAGSICGGVNFWSGVNTLCFTNASKNYTWSAKAAKTSVKYSATKKQTVKITAKGAQGKVTYSVASAPKAGKKAVSVSKSGVVTFAKKAAKGTYKITVKCAGKDLYKASSKTVSIKVK